MAEAPQIEGDFACTGCDYNLRALCCEGVCPECGKSIKQSVTDSDESPRNDDEILNFYSCEQWRPLVETTGCSADAIHFVMSAMRIAMVEYAPYNNPDAQGVHHATARQLCLALRDHAIDYFNDRDEATDLLSEWGIRNSSDVGRIVFALVASGQLKVSREDAPQQFKVCLP